jgi:hypothetical protein
MVPVGVSIVHIGAPERCAVTTMAFSVGAGSWAERGVEAIANPVSTHNCRSTLVTLTEK